MKNLYPFISTDGWLDGEGEPTETVAIPDDEKPF